jgi:hypothetical protein
MTDIVERGRTLTFDTCTADAVAQVRCEWGACQCGDEISAEMATEIERLREALSSARAEVLEEAANSPAWLDAVPAQALVAMHDHIHTIMDERAGNKISDTRRRKAAAARKLKEPKS